MLRARLRILVSCAVRFACTLVLGRAALHGTALPLSLCFHAIAGGGAYGISALLETVTSSLLLPQSAAMAQITAAVLTASTRMVFRGTELEEHPLFLPSAAALMTLLVNGLLLLSGIPGLSTAIGCLARAAVAFGGTILLRRCMETFSYGGMLVLFSDRAETPEAERLIREYPGRSPKELSALLVGQGEEDDRMTVVVRLQRVAARREHPLQCR